MSDDDEEASLLSSADRTANSNAAAGIRCSGTLVIIYLGVAVDAADATLLPAMFKALEEDLHLTPELLGTADFLTSLCAAVFALAWGFAADRLSRVKLLSCAAALWGSFSLAIALSTDRTSFLFFRALNGAALGGLYPIKWSLLSDLAPEESRGRVFGLVGVTGAVGSIAGSLFATTISETTWAGIAGWRLAFALLAVLCVAYSALVWLVAVEPPRGEQGAPVDTPVPLREVCKQVSTNLKFVLLVISEMLGSVPSHAMHWLTLWIQYLGYLNYQAAMLSSVYKAGLIAGSLLGGIASDHCAAKHRASGRIMLAQAAQTVGAALCCLLFSMQTQQLLPLAILLFCVGASLEWVDLGTNKPLLMESVSPRIRGSVSGIEHLAVHTFGSLLGGPLIGYLMVNTFGYEKTSLSVSAMSVQARGANEQSIRHALLWMCTVPYIGCLVVLAMLQKVYSWNAKTSEQLEQSYFKPGSVVPENVENVDIKSFEHK